MRYTSYMLGLLYSPLYHQFIIEELFAAVTGCDKGFGVSHTQCFYCAVVMVFIKLTAPLFNVGSQT